MSISDGHVVYKDNQEQADSENIKSAVFAGGCFWCVESDFHKIQKGLIEVTSGYAGGDKENPTYHDHGDHLEAVEVKYDSNKIQFADLVAYFFKHIDPTDDGGQFYDRGHAYSTAIFYKNDAEQKVIKDEIDKIEAMQIFDKPVATKVLPYKNFYKAEDYHQKYSEKNPEHYQAYREGSGRQRFIDEHWTKAEGSKKPDQGKYIKPDDEVLKEKLTETEYEVTQKDATEPRFQNKYWNHFEEGIYVDRITGEPLFSSKNKYDSGDGWPSFTQPITQDAITQKDDFKIFVPRTELRSKTGDNHLGHVFDDGPTELNGQRCDGKHYCINSAALRFIPKEDLQKEGYGEYSKLFT